MIKKKLFQKIFYNFSKFAASINLKPTALDLTNTKCLCLAPHPDDETIGMGATLALFSKNFDVILLTDGRKGFKEKSVEEVIQLRQEEFKKAMEKAKISNYSFLNVQDKKLFGGFNSFKEISLENYDYIFVPNIIDQHPDHKAVSFLLKEFIESGTKIKPDVKICMYEVWSTLPLTNAFVDVTEVIETKKQMISCYESQTLQKDYEYHALGLNQYRGMLKDKKFVEAFFVMNLKEFKKLCEIYE